MPSTITDRLEGLTTSVAVKPACIAASIAALTLAGTQTVDGVALVAGDRVLVKNQASSIANGIYRGGLKLTCEFYQETAEGVRTFIRNYTLNVGRNGDSVMLTPPEPNKFYYLRIVSAERL